MAQTPTVRRLKSQLIGDSPVFGSPGSPGRPGSLSPPARLFEPPAARLSESGELARMRDSGTFVGLVSPSVSAPMLPQIPPTRSPQMERNVEGFLARRERLTLDAFDSAARAKDNLRKHDAAQKGKGGRRRKRQAEAKARVKQKGEAAADAQKDLRQGQREKARAEARAKMLAQARGKLAQMRKKAQGMSKPKLSFIDHHARLAEKADNPAPDAHSLHRPVEEGGVRIAQGQTFSQLDQAIKLGATLPGAAHYDVPSEGEPRPALPGKQGKSKSAAPFNARGPDEVDIKMRRTALLPSPGEYLVGHAAPFPVGRHGSCEANTAT